MRINTLQTLVLRQLRARREQFLQTSSPDAAGAKEPQTPGKLRRAYARIGSWLAEYYRACGSSGWDSRLSKAFRARDATPRNR